MPATSAITSVPTHNPTGSIVIDGRTIIVERLEVVDPIVVEAVSAAPDAETMFLHLVSLGAVAHRAADADVVASEFRHQMDSAMEVTQQACERFADTVAAQAGRLFDGDEHTPSVTDQITNTMEATLTELLGEDASVGPLAQLRTQVDEALAGHQRHLRNTLSLDSVDSPLAALQANMLKQLDTQNRALVEQVQTLSERLAVDEATRIERAKGTQKGVVFEQVVQDQLVAIATSKGHMVDATGTETGDEHNKKGDHVITIDRGLATEARIVVESKDCGLSARAVTAELDAARTNRNATAAIAVFAHPDQTPMKTPVFLGDFGAVVAFDGINDDVLLRVAYEWAARLATRNDTGSVEVDVHAAQDALADLDKAINNMRAINTALNGIEKNLTAGRDSINDMRNAVLAAAQRARHALLLADPDAAA